MDARDGKVYTKEEMREKFPDDKHREEVIGIEINDQTRKQRERQKISLHDHRSKLGKVLTAKRRELGFHRKR